LIDYPCKLLLHVRSYLLQVKLGWHNFDVGENQLQCWSDITLMGRHNLGWQGNGAIQPDTSTAVHNLLVCAHTLCMNYADYVTKTLLFVSSLVQNKELLCFVHGHGQKSKQKPTKKKFVWFHNDSPLLIVITPSKTCNWVYVFNNKVIISNSTSSPCKILLHVNGKHSSKGIQDALFVADNPNINIWSWNMAD